MHLPFGRTASWFGGSRRWVSLPLRLESVSSPYHSDLRRVAPLLPRASVTRRSLGVWRRITGPDSWKVLPSRRRAARNVEFVDLDNAAIRLHKPPSATTLPVPALLWIHAGGYVMGAAWQDDPLCAMLARDLGVIVAAVDYRLSPEHRFPVPLNDCYEALTWLADRSDVDRDRVAIGGASAGGGLAAALTIVARDRGEVRPVFQLLAYPMLDDRTALRTDIDERYVRMWNNAANRLGWESYLGQQFGTDEVSPLASPGRAEDLAGLPPAWIGVGTLDVLHDEGVAYAKKLTEAGIGCELDVIEGAIHAFDSVRPKAPITERFRAAQVGALGAGLGLR